MSGLGQYADDIKCGKTMESGGLIYAIWGAPKLFWLYFHAFFDLLLNPLTPRSDEHETSANDILKLSSRLLMRIFKLIS